VFGRRGGRWLPVLVSAVLTATLVPTTDAAATGPRHRAAPSQPAQDDGATSITDGLPVAPIGAARPSAEQAIPSVVLPDSGVARAVTREASDGDDVAVIIRLRRQVELDAITDDAQAARGLADTVENRRVAEAGQDARTATVVDALRSFAADNGSPVAGLLQQLVADGHATDVQPYWIFNGWSATVDAEALHQLGSNPDVASVTLDAPLQLPPVDPDEGRASLPTWGLERVRATDVWSQYEDRGRGVVVGIMDSGVDGTHPALARSPSLGSSPPTRTTRHPVTASATAPTSPARSSAARRAKSSVWRRTPRGSRPRSSTTTARRRRAGSTAPSSGCSPPAVTRRPPRTW
jgi:hypothetical protein